ncbi:hypothetical protein [Halosimplex halobium]|uniref:hypothetical protein n=1 Tax=Halosimplex halobium TaxID=3396618 RepID=UPI003F56DCD3
MDESEEPPRESETRSQPGVSGEELEVLLHTHEQLREEIRSHGKRKSRRFVATFTVTGVVVGYVFARGGDLRLVALLPLVLAFQYLSHISAQTYVTELAGIVGRIEKQIDYPGVEYESYYGTLDTGTHPLRSYLGGDEQPTPANDHVDHGLRLIAKLSYVVACWAGLAAFWLDGLRNTGLSTTIATHTVTRAGIVVALALVYGLLGRRVMKAYEAYNRERDIEADLFEVFPTEAYEGVATARRKMRRDE